MTELLHDWESLLNKTYGFECQNKWVSDHWKSLQAELIADKHNDWGLTFRNLVNKHTLTHLKYLQLQMHYFYRHGITELLHREISSNACSDILPHLIKVLLNEPQDQVRVKNKYWEDMNLIFSVHGEWNNPLNSDPVLQSLWKSSYHSNQYEMRLSASLPSVLNRNSLNVDCSQALSLKWFRSHRFLHMELREKNYQSFNPLLGSVYFVMGPNRSHLFLDKNRQPYRFLILDKIQIPVNQFRDQLFFDEVFEFYHLSNIDFILARVDVPISNYRAINVSFNQYCQRKSPAIVQWVKPNKLDTYTKETRMFESMSEHEPPTKKDLVKRDFFLFEFEKKVKLPLSNSLHHHLFMD